MTQFSFAIVDETSVGVADLQFVAAALRLYCNARVATKWGGSASVRASVRVVPPGVTQWNSLDTVVSLRDALPEAPDALGYHDRDGKAVPVIWIAASLCTAGLQGPMSVPAVLSHELAETMADPACNVWCDDGTGTLFAREIADPVQSSVSTLYGVSLSDFVYPSFFTPGADGPYDDLGIVTAPFQTAAGGYQVVRGGAGEPSRVFGSIPRDLLVKKRHWSSRTYRRGARS